MQVTFIELNESPLGVMLVPATVQPCNSDKSSSWGGNSPQILSIIQCPRWGPMGLVGRGGCTTILSYISIQQFHESVLCSREHLCKRHSANPLSSYSMKFLHVELGRRELGVATVVVGTCTTSVRGVSIYFEWLDGNTSYTWRLL